MSSDPESTTTCENNLQQDILDGLSQPQKSLPCKYFYDERGSQLFDQICELDEYYLTRTEQAIMDEHAADMAAGLGEQIMLVEFGSGSSTKTHALLEQLIDPAAYVPLDISEDHLLKTADDLRLSFPHIEILPLVADFTEDFVLPTSSRQPKHNAVYFPGSTIGNFQPAAAGQILDRISRVVRPHGGLLIGVDLQKESAIIERAYNDSRGVTAAFNLNLLRRINVELDANFELDQFEHLAFYNEARGRVEIFIVSKRRQVVEIGDESFSFEKGERIFTEYSHKYTVDGFGELASQAGFAIQDCWTDSRKQFAVVRLRLDDPSPS